MKKIHKRLLLGALWASFTCFSLALTACDNNKDSGGAATPPPAEAPTEPTLAINNDALDVLLGESVQLTAIYEATEGKELVWSSSNPEIVSITDDGLITAKDSGAAIITATYGDLTATCAINVVFGNQQPVLLLKNVLTDNVKFIGTQGFAIDAAVMFNGVEFPCDLTVQSSNPAVTYTDGKLYATGEETAQIDVTASWKGFDSSLLTASFSVASILDVSIVPFVTVNGKESAMNSIDLSIVDEWCGKTYTSTASVRFVGALNGVETALTDVQLIEGDEYVSFDEATGAITALENMRGTAKIQATYEVEGKTYTHALTVNTTCPVEEYDGQLTLDTQADFPLELFGSGATLKEAYQGDEKLMVRRGTKKIFGVVAEGYETEEMTVYTSKGAYHFSNIFAYDKMLTQDNFVSALTLGSSVIDGYIVLGEDVTVDMTAQKEGSKTVYFGGVFDGMGHKVTASVSQNGVFGQLGGLHPTVKNTHFSFTFVAGTDGTASGLAGNKYTVQLEQASTDDTRIRAALDNLYITSTNYLPKAYTLMKEAPYFITASNLYINVDVGTETTGAGSSMAVMYQSDKTLYMSAAAANPHIFAYSNVYLVTGRFTALADVPYTDGVGNKFAFTTYAHTDLAKIGGVRSSNTLSSTESLKIKHSPSITEEQKKYFTADIFGFVCVFTYNNVERYDTVAELTATGVTQVGSWQVV